MHTPERQTGDGEDFEVHWANTSGVDTQVLQLSRGPIHFGLQSLDLGELSLIWTELDGRTRWQDQISGDHLHLGIPIASQGPLKVNGQALDAGDAMIWLPGDVSECVLDGPYRALQIDVQATLQDRLGWEVRGKALNRIPQDILRPLVRTCLAASEALQGPDADEFSQSLSAYWRDEILERLEPVLQPWLVAPEGLVAPSGTPHHHLVRKADRYFATHGYDSDTSVDELANAMGVSRRTIFHAYRTVLGVGPRRYLEVVRLHQLRPALKQATAGATVTDLAMASGFTNLGRLSALYCEQFGEYPSDTLKRARRNLD